MRNGCFIESFSQWRVAGRRLKCLKLSIHLIWCFHININYLLTTRGAYDNYSIYFTSILHIVDIDIIKALEIDDSRTSVGSSLVMLLSFQCFLWFVSWHFCTNSPYSYSKASLCILSSLQFVNIESACSFRWFIHSVWASLSLIHWLGLVVSVEQSVFCQSF